LKRQHFDALRPVCAACLGERGEEHHLFVTVQAKKDGDDLIEGALQCPSPACKREYPVIDGVPLLVPDPRGYLATQLAYLTSRDDLSPLIEGFLGEGSGPGSPLDAGRSQLSSYTWDHYGEFDAQGDQPRSQGGEARPGSVVRALQAGLALAEAHGQRLAGAPVLDLGCAVGRSTFELARGADMVVGADLGFHFLRLAARVLRRGSIRYPRRRVGVLYDWREFEVAVDNRSRVDFWAADAAHLPFPAATFAGAVALNLLDCVYAPLDTLRSLARVLRPGATLLLAAPYDWTPGATAIEAWIGGHSPRSLGGGSSDSVLRALLTPGAHPVSVDGLRLVAERDDIPWTVRMHDRSVVTYRLHMVVAVRS
jgi:SAM-dependent methyltransferase/uncharacterized protein YbaR (Trm112 family)